VGQLEETQLIQQVKVEMVLPLFSQVLQQSVEVAEELVATKHKAQVMEIPEDQVEAVRLLVL
jgi:proteasome assembly chaperone (PAC2) family protein